MFTNANTKKKKQQSFCCQKYYATRFALKNIITHVCQSARITCRCHLRRTVQFFFFHGRQTNRVISRIKYYIHSQRAFSSSAVTSTEQTENVYAEITGKRKAVCPKERRTLYSLVISISVIVRDVGKKQNQFEWHKTFHTVLIRYLYASDPKSLPHGELYFKNRYHIQYVWVFYNIILRKTER